MDCQFRKIKAADYPKIEQLIYETWDYKKYCLKEKSAKYMSKIFLYQCLIEHTFSKVAVYEDEVIGVILGRCQKRKKEEQEVHNKKSKRITKYYFRLFWNIFLFSLSKDGRNNSRLGDIIAQVDKRLYQKCQISFEGELVFFVVDERLRGLGVGKQLFNYFRDYMKYQKTKNFYVFTDTTCNYRFYERQGFERLAEETVKLSTCNGDFYEDFFIYQYEFPAVRHQEISYYFTDLTH